MIIIYCSQMYFLKIILICLKIIIYYVDQLNQNKMNFENFFLGNVNYLHEDLYDVRYNQCVLDFFGKSLDYKRKYSYGYGGYLEKGYEHSGDPNMPDMQESYTLTTGRNESVPPELDFLYQSLFMRLCQLGEKIIDAILENDKLRLSGLSSADFEFTMLVNYFYPYSSTEIESDRAFRMGEHIDESLFTAMPHGAVYDFEVFQDGQWITPHHLERNPIIFPGKLTQFLSGGHIPALKHRVRLSERQSARISYPFMALPKIHTKLAPLGKVDEMVTGREFMEEYLSEHINKNMQY
ncbi:MAG: hypothetical protein E6Q66_07000 [Pedobacter sp.]|nr:MAG: hypothetical protein E6Q66_07000 [Pedobacter sp.]